jgi:DegV family protein with EDD domain
MYLSKKVKILSDATCDLPKELREKFNIDIIPQVVNIDGRDYLDPTEIDPDTLYQLVAKTGQLPKTAANSAQRYYSLMKPYLDSGFDCVIYTISGEMSAAFQNAFVCAQEHEGIYAVDSRSLSMGVGMLCIEGAKMAAQGFSAKEISEKTAAMANKTDVSFVVDTLEYLHKGGRCSGAAKFGANLLKIRPCIEVLNGGMEVGKKYRGASEKVLEEYVNEKLTGLSNVDSSCCYVVHSGMNDGLEFKIAEIAKQVGGFENVYVCRAGCTVSSHCGFGTLGVLFMRK